MSDIHYMQLALKAARNSTELATMMGAIALTVDGIIIAGRNRASDGIEAGDDLLLQVPDKYEYTEYAERLLIYSAAADGISLRGATLYLPCFPCPASARAIVKTKFARLVCYEPDHDPVGWQDDHHYAWTILERSSVQVDFLPPLAIAA